MTNTGATEQRRGRRRQPALPDRRDAEGQGRLEAHPARVPDQRRRRLGDREQGHPDEPLQVRRRLQRRADRLGGAGVQPQDRQAAVQLGRAGADHIPLGDSYATLPTNGFPWDAYHVNSIDLIGNGTFLVSMRDTWAAYLVNIKTGKIEWTLGGKHSSFTLGPGAAFQWQHDVRLQPGGVVTMFDDHCCQLTGGGTYVPATAPFARADAQARPADTHRHARAPVRHRVRPQLRLHGRHTAAAERQRDRRLGIVTATSPSTARSGKPLLDGVLPGSDLSYRATVEPWVGLPLSPPAGAARATRRRRQPCTRAGTAQPRSSPGRSWPDRAPVG